MKRFWIALLGAGLFATAAFAGGDEVPVRMHELPDAAKTLVKKYFHDIEVVSATMEKGVAPSYEVKLADGTKIDFDARGEWTDVERPGGVVPDGLIPQPILKFVAANYPGRHVRGVERDGRNHEITLDNGLELKFNRRFRLVETDDWCGGLRPGGLSCASGPRVPPLCKVKGEFFIYNLSPLALIKSVSLQRKSR